MKDSINNEMQGDNKTALLTRKQLADKLGLSYPTVVRLEAERRLPFIELRPRMRRYNWEDVQTTLKRFTVNAA
jgi:excisionase family DNA binding protein